MFDSLRYAAKLNVAFGFMLNNAEDGSCRYHYTHKKVQFLGGSLSLKATEGVFTKIMKRLSNTNLTENYTRGRAYTKRHLHKLTRITQGRSYGV